MNRIDEWTPVYPKQVASSNEPDGRAGAAAPKAHSSVEAIRGQLLSLDPRPIAVHFYLGEGLRWIRVGFNGGGPLAPSDVKEVGQAISAGIADRKQPLYFHALRPHDLLFFLKGDDLDSTGMPPECFGTPLDVVLQAWGFASSDPSRKTTRRRTA